MKKCLITTLLLALATIGGLAQSALEQHDARKGVLDLRNEELAGTAYSLRGEWAFYPNLLLLPSELSAHKPGYVSFPGVWSKRSGPRDPQNGTATYALT